VEIRRMSRRSRRKSFTPLSSSITEETVFGNCKKCLKMRDLEELADSWYCSGCINEVREECPFCAEVATPTQKNC
jgi:hypothetical protein